MRLVKLSRKRIFILNEPNAPRINPALAKEIGLNESLILLQIEFWISISKNFYDGRYWTYQSVRDMKEKTFPFWSIATINRAVNKLIDEKYLIEGNYNKKKYDKTRWFALNPTKINELKSISMGDETGVFQNDTRSNQNDTRSNQNETTIPEITTETTTEITTNNKEHSPAKAEPQIPYKLIVDYLNKKADRKYRHTTDKTKRLIKSRWNEGFRPKDFEQVINIKVAEWKGTDMAKFLRPETLFGTKFEGYLNQPNPLTDRGSDYSDFDFFG